MVGKWVKGSEGYSGKEKVTSVQNVSSLTT